MLAARRPPAQLDKTPNNGMNPRNILILYAHPYHHRSRIQRALLERIGDLDGVTLHDLYECYPDFLISIGREQGLLREHDVVVLQHPLFWFSGPALLKEWLDVVLEYGFAYGSQGTALHGKYLLQAVSSGGRERAFRPEGSSRFTLSELLRPFEQTARLCGMHYLRPFWVPGSHYMDDERLAGYAADYRERLIALRDGPPPEPFDSRS